MWYVYVIESNTNKFRYVGMSDNPECRLKSHNSGKVKSTKHYKPLRIIYREKVGTRVETRKREIYFKSAAGRKYLKMLVE